MRNWLLVLSFAVLAFACSSEAPPEQARGIAGPEKQAATKPKPEPVPAPAPAAPEEPTAPTEPVADPNEACGRMIVVAYKGADKAPDTITRDKPAAEARVKELLEKLKGGAEFAELARTESDAPSSAARGGTFGTHVKAEWPELHTALRDPLFALAIDGLHPEPIDAPYGYVLLSRCAIEKVRARHILIRYQGAKNADEAVTRTKEQARALATEVRERLVKGEDFDKLARELSEDSSKERGGDIGVLGRGLLAEPFETALFVLKPGGLSPVVETEFGFHVIERLSLEDPPPAEAQPEEDPPSAAPQP